MTEDSPIRHFEYCAACGLMYDTHSVFRSEPYDCPNCLRIALADEIFDTNLELEDAKTERDEYELERDDFENELGYAEETIGKLRTEIANLENSAIESGT